MSSLVLIISVSPIQPYEKQAAADKERAEREKKIYEGGGPVKKSTSKKVAAPYVRTSEISSDGGSD
jgi:hypothetical protein